tara:strand:+ start:763 stop:1305 length:543 start_codon:yes stop_codon:yes gene_type:complete
MAKVRKALSYSKRKPVVNTRWSKRQQHSYLKSVPPQKIVKFNMGNPRAFEKGSFNLKLTLSTQEDIQIRDLALEAVRQALNKDLVKLFTIKNFFLRINVFPHNILRNNRVYSGSSKGERVQTGMTKSFGSPEGRAAVVKKGKPIFTAYFSGKQNIVRVRSFFKKVTPKLPCKTKVILEKV